MGIRCGLRKENLRYYKHLSYLLFAFYISGIVSYLCDDIKKTNMNLDIIKSNELFNLLLSCLGDLLAIIPFIYYKKINRSVKEMKKPKKGKETNKKKLKLEIELIHNKNKFRKPGLYIFLLIDSILDFLDKSLILICLLFIEDETILDSKYIWMFSFHYALRCIPHFFLKKCNLNHNFPNIYIFNFFLLLANGSIPLYNYLYVRKVNIKIYLFIIFSRILIETIMDNISYYIFILNDYHPVKFMPFRGSINRFLFLIFSFVIYFFSKNGDNWVFSFFSNMNFEYPIIIFILFIILYTVSFTLKKMALLLIIVKANPVLASFSRLLYYLEPYISMARMKILYGENTLIDVSEIKYEIISGIFILFAFITSNELIILPCNCLNKDLKIEGYDRAMSGKNKEEEEAEVSENHDEVELNLYPNTENEF